MLVEDDETTDDGDTGVDVVTFSVGERERRPLSLCLELRGDSDANEACDISVDLPSRLHPSSTIFIFNILKRHSHHDNERL